MAPGTLTEYERKRLENIRRNDQMIAALNIHSKASQLSAAATAKRQRTVPPSKSYKPSPEKKPKTQSPIVIRRSLRTRGMPPDSKGLDSDSSESPVSTQKLSSPEKPSPRVLGPLSMRDAYGGTGSDQPLRDFFLSLERKPQLGFPVKIEFAKDEVVKEEDSGGVSLELPERECVLGGGVKVEKKEVESCVDLGSMVLEPDNVARLLPGRIMQVKFLPRHDVRMVVAGNKFGNVAFWNMDCRGEGAEAEEKNNGIFLYRPQNGPVSGIVFHQSCSSKMYTSCYDGFLRLMDVEKEVFDLLYSSDEAIYSLSHRPDDLNSLYFGEGHGGLNVWDERTRGFSSQWVLHEYRINTIDFNPQNPYIMATSSTDGTACLWDLRFMNVDKPKSLKVISHNRAVHSAYFSPAGSSLATTSIDDTVGIVTGVNFEDTSMIYHYNQTGRWLSSFRAVWGWDDSYVYIGNMKRGVDVISPVQRRTIMTLQSPHMSAIPCRFDAHPCKVGLLAGATSGGQVYVWTST